MLLLLLLLLLFMLLELFEALELLLLLLPSMLSFLSLSFLFSKLDSEPVWEMVELALFELLLLGKADIPVILKLP